MKENIRIYHGNFVFSESENKLVEMKDRYMVVSCGIVEGIYDDIPDRYKGAKVVDFKSGVIIPAFSDLHTHAPQYPQRGIAMDALLYDWLQNYTFPLEKKYADALFAEKVYDAFVDDLIAEGTMRVAVYGTIHSEATGILIEKLEKKGIYAFVGKVNMDLNSPSYLCESVESSLYRTEKFLDKYNSNKYAKPLLTPRFAPTCSRELLEGLGGLAKKYEVGVQTHLVESIWEKEEAVKLFPDCSCDTQIYEKTGLLGYGPFFGGHFIFPSEEDIRILKEYGGYAVQCPDATINVIAGIMPTARLMGEGIKLGFGSDVSAGQSLKIYSQIARAVQLSKIKEFYEPENRSISFEQAFYIATKSSGAVFGKTGTFEKGYSFDALVIDGLDDGFVSLSPKQIAERFCYAGAKENIRARFLRGEEIKI